MKDELTKYKERNEVLEAEVSNSANKSPRSGHSRGPSVELRPELDSLRTQLSELRTQSEQATAQNEELQEHIKTLQAEYDTTLNQQAGATTERVAECEAEIQDLQNALEKANRDLEESRSYSRSLKPDSKAVSGDNWAEAKRKLEQDLNAALGKADWLKRENEALEERCKESESKVSLLLDHIETSGGVEAVASSIGHSADHDHGDFDQQRWKRGNNGDARSEAGSDYSASIDSYQQRQQAGGHANGK